MNPPILTVIAGCNGSGKSSFSSAFTPEGVPSFDYDKEFLKIYASMEDSELREKISHNLARQLLEDSVESSIKSKKSFTYETNFNSTPLFWPEKFKEKGFKLRLVYLCLESIQEAKRRVQIRVENGGHYVPEYEIEKRYFAGFKNLNDYWNYFDELFLFETSSFKSPPKHLFSIVNNRVEIEATIPEYLIKLVPTIASQQG